MPTEGDEKFQAIVRALQDVAPGTLCSYGEIAQRAGIPGYARYVAYILKNHAVTANLPWHRIVTHQHHIPFPPNDSRYALQRSLLEAEGLIVKGQRVRPPHQTKNNARQCKSVS